MLIKSLENESDYPSGYPQHGSSFTIPPYSHAFIINPPSLQAAYHAPSSPKHLLLKACMMFCMKNTYIKFIYFGILLIVTAVSLSGCDDNKKDDYNSPSDALKVVIIRHGEKPKEGDNLSCQGQNRALQLAAVLHRKINIPDAIYVPTLKSDDKTKHSRMFQTVSPFAIKYNVTINSKYSSDENAKIVKSVFKNLGTVLMVWEHNAIQPLASSLGVEKPPAWDDADFDSIWVINYQNGKAQLALDKEGLNPADACSY